MQRTSLADVNCSISRTVEIIGEWWTPLILRDLFVGFTRFDDLQRDLGVSTNVLSARLGHLVDNGIVERQQYGSHSRRFEYRLTDKGRDLYPVVIAMMAFGDKWLVGPDGAPAELVHRTCGKVTHAVAHCAECGEPIELDDVEPRVGPGGVSGPGTWTIGQRLTADERAD